MTVEQFNMRTEGRVCVEELKGAEMNILKGLVHVFLVRGMGEWLR